ncbi:NUDIX hydrolase [Lentilactobacillus sp. Marseille-Q4993]|uniref:NUDIX hydrolase n=1 Tax=Lentilactobacillus sp. Marseille-Q4993 TaxID=3039492 RepID=UPI0024BD4247|nr:NUDIX hydrolase [Lentilactobacillus sp. Marseille-Q4993]
MADYVKEIRALVGHKPIFLNACGGALFNEQGEILLQQRSDTGNWSLPGGMMEYGETFAETVRREYKEDSGIEIEPVAQIGVFENGYTKYPNGDETQIISVLYLVKQIGGQRITKPVFETLKTDYFDIHHIPPLLNDQTADMINAAFEFVNK